MKAGYTQNQVWLQTDQTLQVGLLWRSQGFHAIQTVGQRLALPAIAVRVGDTHRLYTQRQQNLGGEVIQTDDS